MSWLSVINQDYQALRNGQPGSRFRNYVDEKRKRSDGKRNLQRVFRNLIGFALIVIGIAIGWLPGPGGFVAIIGLALIAQEVPWIADGLDAIEVGIRRIIGFITACSIFRSE